MTKKRTIMSFVLAICLFVPAMLLLSACGGDDKGGNTKGHVHSYVCEVSTDAYLASSATCTQNPNTITLALVEKRVTKHLIMAMS